jgi:uncharacterized membrane protein YqhA
MKSLYSVLKVIISVISELFLLSGIIITGLDIYDFFEIFHRVQGSDTLVNVVAVGLLQAVDLLLIAIVFFVLSIGTRLLFKDEDKAMPVKLPDWLRVKDFMQLKVILWEAILTTLVVSYLAGMAEIKISGAQLEVQSLILPVGIFLVSLSLYFLKRGEKK